MIIFLTLMLARVLGNSMMMLGATHQLDMIIKYKPKVN
jgi:ABC-type multidrug transport system fused ATPase/permease subunit